MMYKIFTIIFCLFVTTNAVATPNELVNLRKFVNSHSDTKSLCLEQYHRPSEIEMLSYCIEAQERGRMTIEMALSSDETADWVIRTVNRNIDKYRNINEDKIDWEHIGYELNEELTARQDVDVFKSYNTNITDEDEQICYEKYKGYTEIWVNVYECLRKSEYETIKNSTNENTSNNQSSDKKNSDNKNTVDEKTNFISPINFEDTPENREKVISFIKYCVKETYCENDNDCNPIVLRMMEKTNLDSFKNIANPSNKDLMQKTISTYCDYSSCCQYATIEMMYNQMLESENSKLEW